MLRPVFDNIIVREDKKVEKVGKIIIPEHLRKDVVTGTVVFSGKGRRTLKGAFIPNKLKPGDRIVYPDLSGTYVEDNGEKLLCMAEEHVLGMVV
jgi:co-chaperonin GroES (HSP10)